MRISSGSISVDLSTTKELVILWFMNDTDKKEALACIDVNCCEKQRMSKTILQIGMAYYDVCYIEGNKSELEELGMLIADVLHTSEQKPIYVCWNSGDEPHDFNCTKPNLRFALNNQMHIKCIPGSNENVKEFMRICDEQNVHPDPTDQYGDVRYLFVDNDECNDDDYGYAIRSSDWIDEDFYDDIISVSYDFNEDKFYRPEFNSLIDKGYTLQVNVFNMSDSQFKDFEVACFNAGYEWIASGKKHIGRFGIERAHYVIISSESRKMHFSRYSEEVLEYDWNVDFWIRKDQPKVPEQKEDLEKDGSLCIWIKLVAILMCLCFGFAFCAGALSSSDEYEVGKCYSKEDANPFEPMMVIEIVEIRGNWIQYYEIRNGEKSLESSSKNYIDEFNQLVKCPKIED